MMYSVNINFKGNSAYIEKVVINNTEGYRTPNLSISTKDHNAMEVLSKSYLGLYNSVLCQFCERNSLCLQFEEDFNCKIIGKVNLLHKRTRRKIYSADTLEGVIKCIETLIAKIANKNNENNV